MLADTGSSDIHSTIGRYRRTFRTLLISYCDGLVLTLLFRWFFERPVLVTIDFSIDEVIDVLSNDPDTLFYYYSSIVCICRGDVIKCCTHCVTYYYLLWWRMIVVTNDWWRTIVTINSSGSILISLWYCDIVLISWKMPLLWYSMTYIITIDDLLLLTSSDWLTIWRPVLLPVIWLLFNVGVDGDPLMWLKPPIVSIDMILFSMKASNV